MKSNALVLTCVLMCGCGKGETEFQKEQAQLGINRLVSAFMKQDPALLKQLLSKAEIEAVQRRADSAGETFDATLLSAYESQKRGLIMNFGEEWLSKHTLEVSSVKDIGEGVFAVSISFGGEAVYGKSVYFTIEDGEYKFAGIVPPLSSALYSVSAATGWWPYWHVHHYGSGWQGAAFSCGGEIGDTWVFIANLWQGDYATNANCYSYEYWNGSKSTAMRAVWQGEYGGPQTLGGYLCMYQVIGVDALIGSSNHWVCTLP